MQVVFPLLPRILFSIFQVMVGVCVLDINDNDPVLVNLPMNLTLSENTPISSFVTRILAHDADSGRNALLTFNITAGNAENTFYINGTVGLLVSFNLHIATRMTVYRPSHTTCTGANMNYAKGFIHYIQ